jgi:hypothetical protein
MAGELEKAAPFQRGAHVVRQLPADTGLPPEIIRRFHGRTLFLRLGKRN